MEALSNLQGAAIGAELGIQVEYATFTYRAATIPKLLIAPTPIVLVID